MGHEANALRAVFKMSVAAEGAERRRREAELVRDGDAKLANALRAVRADLAGGLASVGAAAARDGAARAEVAGVLRAMVDVVADEALAEDVAALGEATGRVGRGLLALVEAEVGRQLRTEVKCQPIKEASPVLPPFVVAAHDF